VKRVLQCNVEGKLSTWIHSKDGEVQDFGFATSRKVASVVKLDHVVEVVKTARQSLQFERLSCSDSRQSYTQRGRSPTKEGGEIILPPSSVGRNTAI
jgi:hypothetical protein